MVIKRLNISEHLLLAILFCLCVSSAFAIDLPSNRDPRYNSSINPKYNSSINPKYNSSVNPTYNSSINPKYNSSINPNYNTSLNPKYNSSINPTMTTWSGLYIFDVECNLSGVAVRAERGFLLYFGIDGKWQGYFASNGESGYNWFSLEGEWRGYCVHNSERGFNIFTKDGEWLGFMN